MLFSMVLRVWHMASLAAKRHAIRRAAAAATASKQCKAVLRKLFSEKNAPFLNLAESERYVIFKAGKYAYRASS
jgi:hypothetical protein